MSEKTVVAAPSAAQESPKFTQFDGWDEKGTPIVSKPKAAPAPAEQDQPAPEKAKSAPEPGDGEPKQETRRKQDAEARIKQLIAERDEARRERDEARKPKETKAESSPAPERKPEPQFTRPKPKVDDKAEDGKPKYATYEDYVEELADWKAEHRMVQQQREQAQAQKRQTVGQKLEEARTRYEDFDSVASPIIKELLQPDMPKEIFGVLDESPVLADLLYTLGGTEATKNDFLKACRENPAKALRVALLTEQEIVRELAKGKEEKTEAKEPPAQPKPRAPKPPSEVGGKGSVSEDALIAAAKSNDFRSFEQEQLRRFQASRR